MDLTFKRPRRKSMLGTRSRLSIIPDNTEMRRENEVTGMVLRSKLSIHHEIPIPTPEPPKKVDKTLEQVLKNIDDLLEKNSQTLDSLLQEREQLKKMEQLVKGKLSLDDFRDTGLSKENKPPNNNTPPVSCTTGKYDECDDEFVVPQNPIIDEMRSAIKFLKTPRPSRKARKSILLTPHSMSFRIQKQFEDLLE